jgi:hypothetical protein
MHLRFSCVFLWLVSTFFFKDWVTPYIIYLFTYWYLNNIESPFIQNFHQGFVAFLIHLVHTLSSLCIFVSSIFLFFGANVNSVMFLISNTNFSLLAYRKTSDYYISYVFFNLAIVLYLKKIQKKFTGGNSFEKMM